MNTAYWLNTAWMASCAGEARAFDRAVRHVRGTQEKILLSTLRENADTWYGRKYQFRQITNVERYRELVPVITYEALREPVNRIAHGESDVLTRQKVILLEPTGGSTTGEKLIPYTRSLRRQFQRAVAAWVFDTMSKVPGVRCGRAYWSLSPMVQRPRRTPGGLPIGFEDDSDYLGWRERWAISRLLVAPPQIRRLRSIDNARYVSLLFLLANADLTLISIWSPTYFTSLLSRLSEQIEAICADLRDGCVRLPYPSEEPSGVDFALRHKAHARRAGELRRIFDGTALSADQLAACWPHMKLVSCWADASSGLYASQLQMLLPHARFQPKGLLATEGVVSFPLVSAGANVLAVRSHFLEFAEVNCAAPPGRYLLADELEIGGRYRVIMTTGGGLYRYDLGDDVEVTGFHVSCPLVRFIGRSGAVSDLVGEKLHETHVRLSIERACDEFGLPIGFVLLAPVQTVPAHYRLYLESSVERGCRDVCDRGQRLAARVQQLLEENPQYRLAVQLGQLAPLDVCFLKPGAWERYQQACLQRQQSMGDIKPKVLDSWAGWEDLLVRESD